MNCLNSEAFTDLSDVQRVRDDEADLARVDTVGIEDGEKRGRDRDLQHGKCQLTTELPVYLVKAHLYNAVNMLQPVIGNFPNCLSDCATVHLQLNVTSLNGHLREGLMRKDYQ